MAQRGSRDKTDHQVATSAGPLSKGGFLRRKRFIGTAILVLGMAFLAWGFYYTQSPAEGVVVSQSGPPPQTEAASTGTIEGKTFSIDLPGEYKPREVQKPTAPTLEQLAFTARKEVIGSHNISIIIKKSPPAIFKEESALVFRERNPGYTASSMEIDGKQAIKMTKNDGSEITFFVPGPSAYAIIATTSTSPGGQYVQEVNEIIKSFKWN